MDLVHHINQALKAHHLFKRDVDYMLKDGKVIIVDEFTGRLMPGRRYSDGLHQALEAKERVRIEEEYQTLAPITFQNYFRMYKKLAGMTGTAATEATEFGHIYGLDVVEIPTNQTLIRHEAPDVIYRTAREKWEAVAEEIIENNHNGRPVLVGTVSIEKSEHLSSLLRKKGLKHVVLNAKYHEMEAAIIAQAGRIGAVTIATNMAGRGVDILLGGNPEYMAREQLKRTGVDPGQSDARSNGTKPWPTPGKSCKDEHEKVVALGGLHITGTERHEARRIDNQLRGRAGRQGDPGSSRFFLSLEDDLMRIFGSERISGLMARIGMGEGVPIEHNMVSKAIERAQKQVEGPELHHPQTPPRIRRRHEQAARDDLQAAPRDPRRQEHEGLRPRARRAAPRLAHGQLHQRGKVARGLGRRRLPQSDRLPVRAECRRLRHQVGRDHVRRAAAPSSGTAHRRLRGQGKAPRPGADARVRADHPPPGHRHPVEGPPPRAWIISRKASACAATASAIR